MALYAKTLLRDILRLDDSMLLVEISGLERHYEMASEVVKALDGIDLVIEKGERIVLLGPSGSGKTTLLNCIAALDSPTAGEYSFEGKEVPRHKSEEMTGFAGIT